MKALLAKPEKFGPQPPAEISDEKCAKYLEEYQRLVSAQGIEAAASTRAGGGTYSQMLERKEAAERTQVKVEEMSEENEKMLEKMYLRRDCMSLVINDLYRSIRGRFADNMASVNLEPFFR